jgi:hypothetical protein
MVSAEVFSDVIGTDPLADMPRIMQQQCEAKPWHRRRDQSETVVTDDGIAIRTHGNLIHSRRAVPRITVWQPNDPVISRAFARHRPALAS